MRSRHAKSILGLVSFSESVIAPIITDPFLIAIILIDRAHWIRYTIITILTSVAGGVVAYFLGALFFEVFGSWAITIFQSEDLFTYAQQQLKNAGFWFVFLGALTPIPYKLVALASGFVELSLAVFITASLLGRTLRFALTGYLAYAFGPLAVQVFRHRINYFLLLLVLAAGAYIVLQLW